MSKEQFESVIKEKVVGCFNQANRYFNKNIKVAAVAFNQRGSAAGTAYLQRHEVRFNYDMYLQDPEEFLRTVVPHEVAHLFVYQLFGSSPRPHGKEWQSVMQKVFFLKPNRTHNFKVKSPITTFDYLCNCTEHALTIRRHNKILKGSVYQCRTCKTSLRKK